MSDTGTGSKEGSTQDASSHDASVEADHAHDAAADAHDGAGGLDAHPDVRLDSGPDMGSPALSYVGRIDYGDLAGPRFEWSGTEVIARFTGTGVTLEMTDDGNYFDVFIDGELQTTPILGAAGQTDYVLASGLTAGTHEVRMHRRTEADVGTTQILGVTFPAGGALLSPSPRPNRRIEVVGDSISCGFGVLGVGPADCGSSDNEDEDHDDSYGAVAAAALGADLITTAWSGEGMYENYGGAMTSTLPDLYPYTLPAEPSAATMWTFSSWTPDAVVINLGTNDFWNGDPGMGYEQAYLAFVETVRTNYPNAYIVCANGPMLLDADHTTAETYINSVISQRALAGDTRIAYLDLGVQDGSDGYGCNYHPNVMTQAEMATTLESALETALGW